MKRYPVVIAATLTGLAGILSFHTSNSSGPLSNDLAVGPTGAASTATTGPPHRTPVTGGTPGSAPPPTSTSVPSTSGTLSATGANEQYGYGVLSVKVTVKDSKIVDVAVSNLQTAETYSQSLAQQVVPYLRRQVLSAQSAHIDGISGATYTSDAYALSVQSALDQLHFK
jgi:uncharacterized protein with FMN-binding domain